LANPAEFEAMLYGMRGIAYHAKGDYDHAIVDFSQAIRLNPKLSLVYVGRSGAYYFKGEYDHAIADLNQVIKDNDSPSPSEGRSPNNSLPPDGRWIVYSLRGAAYSVKGEYDRAIADFDQALQSPRTDPPFPSTLISYLRLAFAHAHRGYAYGRKGDFDRAMPDLNKAIELDPRFARAYALRAAIYALRGDAAHAIADADEALQLDPSDAFAYNARGKAYLDRGQFGLAIIDYEQALRLDPALIEARQNRDRARAAFALSQPSPPHGTFAAPPAPPPSFAAAERRIALVIGNSQYRAVPALPNPRRDAEAVAAALREAGFQAVMLVNDLDRDGMMRTLRAFRDQADSADWALVYFAGHGIEINRANYLIPVDAKLADSRDVKAETVAYDDVLTAVGGARALRIIVLDACRINPFREHMRLSLASRGSLDRGLAQPPEIEAGTLVVYSAKEGEVAADDVDGVNSPFARAFVARLKVPGREVRRVFDDVRDDVLGATGRRQQPFTYGSLPGSRDFFFVTR
jgi:tetratricopeptide (TPR) repeat protein